MPEAPRPETLRPGRTALALVALLGVATLLRVHEIGRQDFWIDELASLAVSRDGLEALVSRSKIDVHPPLYFALLHFWGRLFGESEAALRMLSVVPSVATVALLFRLGTTLRDTRAGWIAALLSATSLLAIDYAQEARSYAWLMFFSVLSTHLLVRWRLRGLARDALLYAACTAALLYTHYFSFLFVFAQALYVFVAQSSKDVPRRFLLGWCGAVAVALLAFAPWLGTFLSQFASVRTGFWIEPPHALAWLWAPLSFLSWWGPWSESLAPASFGIAVAFAAVLGTLAIVSRTSIGARLGAPDRADAALPAVEVTWLLGLWLTVPIACALLLSGFGVEVFSYRNTTVSAAALWLLAAIWLSRIASSKLRAVLLAALLAPSLGQLPGYYREPHKDQWRAAAAFVEAGYHPDRDVLAFDAPFIRFAFGHYAALEDPVIVSLQGDTLPAAERLWLVRAYAGPDSRSRELVAAWGYQRRSHFAARNVEVELFERESQPAD
ncbi:MAG: glycosyltransferase family 39 protein [Myxococcota bacterium]|jgi:uncharacterized membrane protein